MLRGESRRRLVLRLQGLCLLASLLSACVRSAPEKRTSAGLSWTEQPGQSVIVIVNDAMRRDRLGAYGGPARTPRFDSFAREGILFRNACTQAPWTKPSVATLFTSLYPSQHGVLSHPRIRSGDSDAAGEILRTDILGDGFTTLAEAMRAGGLRTAAFVGNPWLRKEFGFGQGFETYDDSFASWNVSGESISRKALDWVGSLARGERFFLYLHYMDSHRPYHRFAESEIPDVARDVRAGETSFPPAARDQIAALIRLADGRLASEVGVPASPRLLEIAYDRGIEDFDRALGVFLDRFQEHPEHRRTAILVTADHGEALYTRGYGNHGDGLYEDEVAIPMAARLPGVSAPGRAVTAPVGLVDLMPTLCAFAAVRCPTPVFGMNLLSPAGNEGGPDDRFLVTEGVMHKPGNRAIRHGRYKLLWQPQRGYDGGLNELFDLVADPGESHDLLGSERRAGGVEAIQPVLLRGGAAAVPPFTAPEQADVPLDPELEQRLRALGYIR